MPLFDYRCRECDLRFERIARSRDDAEAGVCPECASSGAEILISRFRVGGRGDLRESSEYHGCHAAIDDPASEPAHVHGPGCGHGGGVPDS